MKYIETLHQNQHMQGFTSDGNYMYWSFTDTVVKTTLKGTVRRCVPISGGHLGDIDYFEGKLYASFMGDARPGHAWNDWTSTLIYVTDPELHTLQYLMMRLVKEAETANQMSMQAAMSKDQVVSTVTGDTVKAATLIITTLPILMLYPFLQKYFIKGINIGAVKG